MPTSAKVAIAILLVLLVGAACYWYDLRPATWRRACGNLVYDDILIGRTRSGLTDPDGFRVTYENCLHRHGLDR